MSDPVASVLSGPCLRALQLATAAACAEVLYSAPPSQLWTHVVSAVVSVIQEQARLHTASRSPAAKLPDELLVEIFARLPLWDRMRAATVCHRWRSVSLNAASRLWCSISNVTSLDTCTALLARAGRFPVAFRYTMRDDNAVPALCRIFLDHMHHIRVLELNLPRGNSGEDGASLSHSLAEALECDAPVLETLRMSDPVGRHSEDLRRLPVLRNTSLQHIDLHNVSLSFLAECGSPATVRTLRASTERAEFSAEHWLLLCSFAGLEALALRITAWRSRTVADLPGLQLEGRVPATVRRLHLDMDWDTARQILTSDVLAQLDSCCISLRSPHRPRLAAFAPFLHSDIVAAALHIAPSDRFVDLTATSAAGREMAIAGARWDAACWALAARVRTLYLQVAGLQRLADDRAHVAVDFPVLQDFTLDTAASSRLGIIEEQPGPRLPERPRLRCPALRSLRIVMESDSAPLELEDAVAFLRNTLDFGPNKLSTLCFHGVPVVSKDGSDVVTALQEFADIVSLSISAELWPGSDRLGNWDRCVLSPQL